MSDSHKPKIYMTPTKLASMKECYRRTYELQLGRRTDVSKVTRGTGLTRSDLRELRIEIMDICRGDRILKKMAIALETATGDKYEYRVTDEDLSHRWFEKGYPNVMQRLSDMDAVARRIVGGK